MRSPTTIGPRTGAGRTGEGPPPVERIVHRVALAVLAVACTWFVITAAWGMLAIPAAGHLGAGNAGTFMAAEQMIRWHILYPARSWYTGIRPEGAALMCHHPYGQYYVPAVLYWLFGHHDGLIHVPAIVTSAAIPPLLFGIAKERWDVPTGAVAAAAFVVVPIAVGFSCYWNLESICIFGSLLFFWGHSRHLATSKRRYLVASLLGVVVACTGDWVGYLLVTPTLGWAFLRAFVLPARLSPRVRSGPYAQWWALSVVLMVALLMWIVGLFAHADQIGQWLGAEESRGGGKLGGLREALIARSAWIDFSFTPLAIALGKIAAPVCLLRFLVLRRDEETYALGLLFGAVVQYVAFKRGADVHIYWPHYFAAYFALSLATLCATVGDALRWLLARRIRLSSPGVAGITLALGLLPVLAMAHDGVKSLLVWQRTGGRYDERGSFIRSQVDLLTVIQDVVMPQTRRGVAMDVARDPGWGWEFQWKYEGPGKEVDAPVLGAADVAKHPFWLARGSGLGGDAQRKIAAASHVRIYGDAWIVDQREAPALLDAFAIEEREPGPLERFLYGGTEPMRKVGTAPDPWRTWDWRVHLGQAASAPTGQPTTLEEIRIAHNVAVANGDAPSAGRFREAILQALDRKVGAPFSQGVSLLGVRVTGSAQPRVESWFEITGDHPLGELTFSVRSAVEAKAPLSLVPPDPTEREMAAAPTLSTKLWKPRFIYVTDAVLDHRLGRERYSGRFRSHDGSPAPERLDGTPQTVLAVVE
jgi:4-amino-4-deoxy-L-arabinose transferase-like glycosyltransferase